jgi:nitrogen regulatory protein P-II 1
MKEIKAILRPERVTQVVEALVELGDLPGVTIADVQGFGKGRWRHDPDKTVEGKLAYVSRVKLEIVVPDARVAAVVDCIATVAHTGNTGDGKIWVIPVAETVKIRTGERGEAAV